MFLRHFGLMFLLMLFAWIPSESSAQESRACYTGPTGTVGVGICRPGTQTRTATGWSACEGEVLPLADVPDNGIDEDCNGVVLSSVVSGANLRTEQPILPIAMGILVTCVLVIFLWSRKRTGMNGR